MKRSLFVIVAAFLAVPLLGSAVAYGETGTGDTANTNSTVSPQQTTSDDTTTTQANETENETEAVKTERSNRIKKEVETQKVRLSATEKKKIQTNCTASQGKVSAVGSRLNGIETSRTEVHKNILNRLNNAVTALKAKGVDTTTLEADIATLSTKIDTFNTDLATYKQSVTDLKAMDCKSNPEGFKAALVTARANLEKVKADATAVHTYLKDTIRPLLTELKKQLESTEQTEGSTGTQLNATDGGNQ